MLISKDKKRNQRYNEFLNKKNTLEDIITFGEKMMKWKIHHHFFLDGSIRKTAEHLTLFVLKNRDLNLESQIEILKVFEKRISDRVPVEYITNSATYLGREFYVNENVLTPRSIMSYRFQDFLHSLHYESYRILDLCTGSGCIGISFALLNPKIQVDLSDISSKALEVANINIKNHNLQDRVNVIESNLFENIDKKYDLIISNPPYVSQKDYNNTPLEFKNEPKIALEAGKDGLDLVHLILTQASQHLTDKGKLIMEVGYDSAKLLKKRYPKTKFTWYKYRNEKNQESFWGMDGCLECSKSNLPKRINKNSWFQNMIDKLLF